MISPSLTVAFPGSGRLAIYDYRLRWLTNMFLVGIHAFNVSSGPFQAPDFMGYVFEDHLRTLAESSLRLCSVHLHYGLHNEPHAYPLCPLEFQPSLRGARALSGLVPVQPDANPFDTREVLDVCGSIDTKLKVPDQNKGITPVGIFGQSDAQPTWRTVRVISLAFARKTRLPFISIFNLRWWMHAPPDADRPGPGVADVSCLSGEYVTHRCISGAMPSSCLATAHTSPHRLTSPFPTSPCPRKTRSTSSDALRTRELSHRHLGRNNCWNQRSKCMRLFTLSPRRSPAEIYFH